MNGLKQELRNFAQRVGRDNYPPTPPNRRSDSLPRPEAKTKKDKKNVKAEAKAKKGKKSRKANKKANDMSAELLARVRRVADMLDPPTPVISPDWWRVNDVVAFPPSNSSSSNNPNSNSNPNNSNPEVIPANEVPPLIPGDFRDSDTSDDEGMPGTDFDGKENEEEGLLSTFIEEENYSDQPQTVYGAYFNSSTAEKEKEEEEQRQKEQQRQQNGIRRSSFVELSSNKAVHSKAYFTYIRDWAILRVMNQNYGHPYKVRLNYYLGLIVCVFFFFLFLSHPLIFPFYRLLSIHRPPLLPLQPREDPHPVAAGGKHQLVRELGGSADPDRPRDLLPPRPLRHAEGSRGFH